MDFGPTMAQYNVTEFIRNKILPHSSTAQLKAWLSGYAPNGRTPLIQLCQSIVGFTFQPIQVYSSHYYHDEEVEKHRKEQKNIQIEQVGRFFRFLVDDLLGFLVGLHPEGLLQMEKVSHVKLAGKSTLTIYIFK